MPSFTDLLAIADNATAAAKQQRLTDAATSRHAAALRPQKERVVVCLLHANSDTKTAERLNLHCAVSKRLENNDIRVINTDQTDYSQNIRDLYETGVPMVIVTMITPDLVDVIFTLDERLRDVIDSDRVRVLPLCIREVTGFGNLWITQYAYVPRSGREPIWVVNNRNSEKRYVEIAQEISKSCNALRGEEG